MFVLKNPEKIYYTVTCYKCKTIFQAGKDEIEQLGKTYCSFDCPVCKTTRYGKYEETIIYVDP